jgi:hypothetical protein
MTPAEWYGVIILIISLMAGDVVVDERIRDVSPDGGPVSSITIDINTVLEQR